MCSLIRWLLTCLIPDGSTPPAASEYDEQDWKKRTHNRPFVSVTNRTMALALKKVDEQTKQRYDKMDRHVMALCELKLKIRARKKAQKVADAIAGPEPEPA